MRNRRLGHVGLRVSERSPGPWAACRGPLSLRAAVESQESCFLNGRYRVSVPADSLGAMQGINVLIAGLTDTRKNATAAQFQPATSALGGNPALASMLTPEVIRCIEAVCKPSVQ